MDNPLQRDSVEFFLEKSPVPFCRIASSFKPADGDIVNIRKANYIVLGVSFAVDYADEPFSKVMRCNVIVEAMPPEKPKRRRK